MEVLFYADLTYSKVKKQFDKTVAYLKAGDFHSADVKKMPTTGYYRAKLDDTHRLLFKIGTYQGKKYIFILEVILNHEYEKSRFLNGAAVDESKCLVIKDENALQEADITAVSFVNQKQKVFHILDKIISFDDAQDEILHLPAPLIVIGSAGSGKTALTLEKVKILKGKILYITLSPYLVENSRNLYYSFDYENTHQEVEFLSFLDFVSMIEVPKGKEIDFKYFEQWISRYKQSHKIKDSYKVFEEFKGVITGSIIDKPYLSKDEYLNLGIKQSIFSSGERELVYDLFLKYREYLATSPYFDSNLLAFDYLQRIEQEYDFAVIDEVQDITNVQLYLIIKSLKHASNFILCGDANQIVHPNFFSWSQLKSLFYKQDLQANIIRVLVSNYRNTPEVTTIANQLLRIKNTRFGSIDKESTFLVESRSQHKGEVVFLENLPKTKKDLNEKTRLSTKFAVLVMRNEDKAAAKSFFQTPLLFSIQEAKGLEYENIILFNMVSQYEKEFRELTNGVNKEDLQGDLQYARNRDKADKSLDEYKFYVNSLYVAMTRAVKNLYVIESNQKHSLLELLELTNFKQHNDMKMQTSSAEDWQKEARRLEMQGKQEQAEEIRKSILKTQPVPWEIITRKNYEELEKQALSKEFFNKKSKDKILDFALFYSNTRLIEELAKLNYKPAERRGDARKDMNRRLFDEYGWDSLKLITPKLQKYGLDFRNPLNQTALMCAIDQSAVKIIYYLLENGAKTDAVDNLGRNALQVMLGKGYDTLMKRILQEKNQKVEKEVAKRVAQLQDWKVPGKYKVTPQQIAGINNELDITIPKLQKIRELLKDKVTENDQKYFSQILNVFYPQLKTESIKLKIANRLVKLDSHQAEYFIFSFMLSSFYSRIVGSVPLAAKSLYSFDMPTYKTDDFIGFYEDLAQTVMPDYRRKRSYISSILSKNEVYREDKYNKKLFSRLRQGEYIINPQVEIWVEDNWVNYYNLIGMDGLIKMHKDEHSAFFNMFLACKQRLEIKT